MAVVGRESALRSRRLLEVKLPCRLGIGDFRCGADARIRAFGPFLPFGMELVTAVQHP